MCGVDNNRSYPSKKAEDRLSGLIQDETGVLIEPKLLRLFLRSNWERVTALAHKIHEGT